MSTNFSGLTKPPVVIPEIEGWQGYTVLGLIAFMLIALVAELAPPYLVMMGTLVIFLALSILDVDAALHGFADEAMLSVAVLFVVARGIEQSGGLEYVASVLFRTPDKTKELLPGFRPSKTKGSIVWVLLKFSVPVAIFSAFLANIPLVAMMIPPIVEFGKKVNLPPSKMLMPLSYAAQLGGTMTLIGASTNLVVLSMAAQKLPDMKMNLFEIGIIGVPVTIAGILYIIAFSGKLLPDRLALQPTSINAREYNVVLVMKPTSSLARKSIDKSGLNRQPGLTLLSVDRDGTETKNPGNDFILQPKDRLHFVGVIDSLLLLVQLNGLALTEDEGQDQVDLNRLKTTQCLVEAVVASESPMVHKRIADLQFRERYKAAIVAIHRYGTRLSSAIGDIKIEAGDCLLMVADGPEFVTKHRNNSTFALVAQLPGFKPLNRKKAGIAAVLVLAMVVASGVGMKLITAALFSSAGLLITRCLTPRDAMESIELPVLIMIAAAFGIAEGMVESGAATILAKGLMGLAGQSLFGLIMCTYVATTFFSLAITNSAAVTIMFPVALAAANHQKLDFRPFAYILMMAASAGFMTPTGCPTNLMVYTPGGYKFSDFLLYGGPMQILLLLVTVGITMTAKYWWIWWLLITLITLISIPLIARHKSTHPKPVDAPAAPPNAKPSTPDTDAENPKAPLNGGNADSSKFALYSTATLASDHASSSPGTSNSVPSSLPTSPQGLPAPPAKNDGREDFSRRISGSSSLSRPSSTYVTGQPSTMTTSQEVPVPSSSSSSSSTSKPFLDSASSNSLSTFTIDILTEPIPKPTLPVYSVPRPSWRPSISSSKTLSIQKQPVSSLEPTCLPSTPKSGTLPSTPTTLEIQGTSLPEPSISVSEIPSPKPVSQMNQKSPSIYVSALIPSTSGPGTPSSKPANLPIQTTPAPGSVSPPTASTPSAGTPLSKPASLPTQITRSPDSESSAVPSNPRAGLLLTRTASLPGRRLSQSPSPVLTPMPSPFRKPAASPVQIEPSSSQTLKPVTSILESRLTTLPIQHLPTPVPVSISTPSFRGPRTSAAEHTSMLPQEPPPPIPVALPITGLGTEEAKRPSSVQEPPPTSPAALPIPTIPGPGKAAAKRPSLPVQEPPPPIPVALPIPTIPAPGTAAAKRPSLPVQAPPPTSPAALPIPTIPGPGKAATKRPSLPVQEPPPPIPVALPIPTIPGPRTAAAKRASLPPQEPPPLPISAASPIPSIPGPGTIAAKRASLPQEHPSLPLPVTLPVPSIPAPGTAASKHASLPPQEQPAPVPVPLTIPNILGPGTTVVERASLPPVEHLPLTPMALQSPTILGPGTAGKRASLLSHEQPSGNSVGLPVNIIPGPDTLVAKSSSLITEERTPIPEPIQEYNNTRAVASSSNTQIENQSSQNSSSPIVMRTYIPKRPSDLPTPTSGASDQNVKNGDMNSFVNGHVLENGRFVPVHRNKSFIKGSESSKPPPLFFTSSNSSSKPRRLTSQPWTTPVQPSPTHRPSLGDNTKRRSSKFAEEDLTGGISNLMNSRKLSSMRDADAFADRWQSTTT